MTIREIAKLAGCSPSAVSRVLSGNHGNVRISEKRRQHIFAICREYGYEPNIHASRLFSKQVGIVGLLIPEGENGLDDPNLSAFANGVYATLNRNDYRLLLMMITPKFLETHEHRSLFRRKEVDALIVWGACGDCSWLDDLHMDGHSFVLASNRMGDHPGVFVDDGYGMQAMVQQCLAKGARRFLYVDGADVEMGIRRKEAFIKSVAPHSYEILPGDFSMAAGRRAVDKIKAHSVDAVLCVNDRTALGVINGLQEMGITVPDEVLVTGADNIELAGYANPPLTTYDQMADQCGRKCAQSLLQHLKQGAPLANIVVAPDLHIRQSA